MRALTNTVPDICTDKDQLPAILSINETAKFMRINTKKVRDAITEGDLHAVKVGRIYRIPKESVFQWMGQA